MANNRHTNAVRERLDDIIYSISNKLVPKSKEGGVGYQVLSLHFFGTPFL